VDEIIHLGDHWDAQSMVPHKNRVLEINHETSRLFRRAYDYLSMAEKANGVIESAVRDTGALDFRGLDDQATAVAADALGTETREGYGAARHLFASAISPAGLKNHLETLTWGLGRKYLVVGKPGTGRTTLVKKVADMIRSRGFHVEYYHCCLDPERIDHAIVPELRTGIFNASEPHAIMPDAGDVLVNTGQFVDANRFERLSGEIQEAEDLYSRALGNGLVFMSLAKRTHDELEKYYSPYMDFAAIDARRERTLDRILELGLAGRPEQ
jgi:hypothetical protein